MGRKAAFVAALVTLWVLPASAQSRSANSAHSVVSRSPGAVRSARSYAVPVRSRTASSRNPGSVANSAFNTGVYSGGALQDLFGYPVPGLGFDYANYAALNGNLGVEALINPATQAQIALALRLRGTGIGGAAYFYSPFGAAPIAFDSPASVPAQPDPPPQPPIVVVAPPAPQPAVEAQPVAEEQPLPDPGEFVLVQRDGRLLFAVAFTSDPGRVVYITKEGLRRSIALDQLDVEATLRMNEERGTSIQLPKA